MSESTLRTVLLTLLETSYCDDTCVSQWGEYPCDCWKVNLRALLTANPSSQADASVPVQDEDCHVAWCRYIPTSGGRQGPIVTCDSDALGAFKVYRHPASSQAEHDNAMWKASLTKLEQAICNRLAQREPYVHAWREQTQIVREEYFRLKVLEPPTQP